MRARYAGKAQRSFVVRIRYGVGLGKNGSDLRGRFEVLAKDEAARDAKRDRMTKMAADMATSGLHGDVKAVLDEAGIAPSDVVLSGIEEMVRGLCAEARAKGEAMAAGRQLEPSAKTTFAEVAELLFERQKAKGNSPKSIGRDRQRLSVIAPRIAKLGVGEITHVIARQAMALVPPDVQVSRCLYEGLISRVLKHAVELGCIEASPLKPGFVSPQPEPKRLFQYLRVSEDAGLLSCRKVLLGRRIAYGFMSRESPRPEFLTIFTWADIDLESGLLTHLHKTKRVRRWQVCERVLRVLRAWRALHPAAVRVFPDWDHRNVAEQLRQDLWTANQRRKALHEDTDKERRLAMKDGGRATFVTLSKRAGAPQHWILDRTGHCTDEMMARYDRMARESQDTIRSWLTPLDQLLGEELGLEPLDAPFVVPWLQGLGASAMAAPQPALPAEVERLMGRLMALSTKLVATPRGDAIAPLGTMQVLAHSPGQQVGHDCELVSELEDLGPASVTSRYCTTSQQEPQNTLNSASAYPSKYDITPHGPPPFVGVGQSLDAGGPNAAAPPAPLADPIELALARALVAASEAQQWDVVLVLRSDLAERHRTRQAGQIAAELYQAREVALATLPPDPETGVVDVSAFRKRHGKGGAK